MKRFERAGLLLLLAVPLTWGTGCGYISKYAAPRDGRARLVWHYNRLQMDLGGVPITPACQREVEGLVNRAVAKADRPRWSTSPIAGSSWELILVDGRTGTASIVGTVGGGRSPTDRRVTEIVPEPWSPRYYFTRRLRLASSLKSDPWPDGAGPIFSPRLFDSQSLPLAVLGDSGLTPDSNSWLGGPSPTDRVGRRAQWNMTTSILVIGTLFSAILATVAPVWSYSKVIPIADTSVVSAVNAYNDLARQPGSPCAYDAFMEE